MLLDTKKTYFSKHYVYTFDQLITKNCICVTAFEPIYGELVCRNYTEIEVNVDIIDKCVTAVGVSWRDGEYCEVYRRIKKLLNHFIDLGEDED